MNVDDTELVVFESGLRSNFYPLTLTRPTFDLNFGAGTVLGRIEEKLSSKVSVLLVPEYLKELTREKHPSAKVNENLSERCLVVNSLVANMKEVWNLIALVLSQNTNTVFYDSLGTPVVGVLEELTADQVEHDFKRSGIKSKQIPANNEDSFLIRFPWKFVEDNGRAIVEDFSRKHSDGYHSVDNCETRGNKLSISTTADIERFVTLDSRSGPVIIEDEAYVQSFSHLTGPCFIGKRSIIKSAKIREGTTIGESCRVAGEVEDTIISDYTNKNHDGFVGHSIIGSWVNLGAMTTTSDLKNTYGEIKVDIGNKQIRTGSVKVGALLADMAKTAIGTMISSGKSIGVSSHALGDVTENIPSFTMHSGPPRNKAVEMYLDSAIEIQRRMMKRRNIQISDTYVSMIKTVFRMTKRDRTVHHVSKGKFK